MSTSASERPVTTSTFREKKAAGERMVLVTAYDLTSGRVADAAGVDAILVGDSLGMTVLGYPSTLPVSMDDMVRHTAAVGRGVERALVIGDMPFMSYQVSAEAALENAARLMVEGGAGAVKLEGGRTVAGTVRRIVDAGMPVMGHVGLTPQSIHQLGGYKAQGKEAAAAVGLIEDCRALEEAGAFSVVLECIPAELAAIVTREIGIATVGIGAGAGCDAEIQVFHDVLGMGDFTPRHARRFAEVGEAMREALDAYVAETRAGRFPTEENTTALDPEVLAEVEEYVTGKG